MQPLFKDSLDNGRVKSEDTDAGREEASQPFLPSRFIHRFYGDLQEVCDLLRGE
jgi:hypothetical protein